jgi:drug/metabolite transporter (DMT)-like permease
VEVKPLSDAVTYALLSLGSAGLLDVVYKRYSRKTRSRGTYVFGIGVVWAMLQTSVIIMKQDVLLLDSVSIGFGLLAGLFLTLSNILLLESLTHIDVSLGSTVYRLNSLAVVVMSWLFLGEDLGLLKLSGIGFGVIAVCLLYQRGSGSLDDGKPHPFLPFFLMAIAASFFRASYGVATRGGILNEADPQTMLLLCAVSWIVGGALYARLREGRFQLTKKKIGYASVSGVLVFLVVYFLMQAVRFGEASIVIPIANMSFVMAMGISVILRFESFTPRKAAAMVVAALAIVTLALAA